ncbi:MAG: tRNA uridine-5-carboxymethylaminomethyl(34) synthesis GTPase MnmE [Bacteroidales bacterium]
MSSKPFSQETICAPATPPGTGALAVVRLSGPGSVEIAGKMFFPANKALTIEKTESHRALFGYIRQGDEVIDEVIATLFRAPRSYTGEDIVEFSCHGSPYIVKRVIELMIELGARLAHPGEFTQRAFLNGRVDLTQAEAVADLIAAESQGAHRIAMEQMRGEFSKTLRNLRGQLLEFISLIELELDFSEEDVEFADREKLNKLLDSIIETVENLASSFRLGQVIKKGIPVAIAGKPNAGKSTLLNAILNEDRALVSEIPGTTRDAIEDVLNLKGASFRFIDTAGLRHSGDKIEQMGIEKTYEKIRQAEIILYVFDINSTDCEALNEELSEFRNQSGIAEQESEKKLILIANKTDQLSETPHHFSELVDKGCIFISAKRKENIHLIFEALNEYVEAKPSGGDQVITNVRHYEALQQTARALSEAREGLRNQIPTDLVATDIRSALYHMGTITGEISTDEMLGNIFSNFCIGK